MPYQDHPAQPEPPLDTIQASEGDVLIEFGASWCPHCLRIQGDLRDALAAHPDASHVKVEDGPGKPLGRAFRVRLWPTLVRLRDGVEQARVVRPTTRAAIDALWAG